MVGIKRQSLNFLKYIKEFIQELKNCGEEMFEKVQFFVKNIGTGVFTESKFSS